MPLSVPIQVLPHASALALPAYATAGSAGLDLRAAIAEPKILKPLERALIPTGIKIAVPAGYEAQVRPRSGLALKHGITMLNSPGTIDSDYRGEVGVIAVNLSKEAFTIQPGERIAQLVFASVARVQWSPCADLEATERAEGGFGSSGRA